MATTSDTAIALVPLRGGSRGLPGKNLRELAGKPLYRHAVDQALRTVGRCLVTTDIEEVLSSDLPEGCIPVRRPADLAGDETPMEPVIVHALRAAAITQGPVCLLQPTSPLRADSDIAEAMQLHRQRGFSLIMSVTEADAGVQKWGRVVDGEFRPLTEPELCFQNRQTLPPVYRPNGAIYIFEATDFLQEGTFPTRNIGAYLMPKSRSADIDTIEDFELAELVMQRQAH